MPHVTVQLLGGFEVCVDGRTVPAGAWRHRRANVFPGGTPTSGYRIDQPAPAGCADLG